MSEPESVPEVKIVSATRRKSQCAMTLHEDYSGAEVSDLSAASLLVSTKACQAGILAGYKNHRLISLTASSSNFFQRNTGDTLVSIAEPIYAQDDEQVWRARVYRTPVKKDPHQDYLTAEFTHSFKISEPVSKPDGIGSGNHGQTTPDDALEVGTETSKSTKTADKRRMQIFQGACDVIAKKGYGNATIRDIAKAANISIPSMYQYVENKEDILYLITSMCMEEILEFFQSNVDADKEPVTALTDAIEAYFRYINTNRRYINLVYSETRALGPENREKIFLMERKFMKLWEDILTNGKEQGVFSIANTDLYANFIYFFCTIWSLRYWSIGHYDESQVRTEITSMIMKAIVK